MTAWYGPAFATPLSGAHRASFTGLSLPSASASRCNARPRACAVVPRQISAPAPITARVQPVVAHPGYQLVPTPHLLDYLPDLQPQDNPLLAKRLRRGFVTAEQVVLRSVVAEPNDTTPVQAFTRAGPREEVFFGRGVRAAIVSCGGICPGINTVIRELTLCLGQYDAGVVFGVQHGYVLRDSSLARVRR